MARMWTKDEILAKLESDNRMVERSLVKLFERQTAEEQSYDQTTENNGVGFNGVDAEFLSSLAKQVMANKYGRPEGDRLSAKQFTAARKSIKKYARQLAEIASESPRPEPAPAKLLDMSTRRNRSKSVSTGWADSWTEEVRLLVPEATDEQLAKYVRGFNGSSQGALRWTTFIYEGRTLDGWVILTVTEHLAD